MESIGFVGLGQMGGPMARNLVAGGYAVIGYDIDPDRVAAHVANGGTVAASAAEAAAGAQFVVTMLPNGALVRAALFETDGIAEAMSREALFIDMSTVHPRETDANRSALKERDIAMVDAPVGRTSIQAEQGKLLIMAGGEAADLERSRLLFECLGDTIVDCGGPGTGSRLKIVNNFMSTVLNVLTAETLTLADAAGLDQAVVLEVLRGTPAGQGSINTTYPAKVLQGDLSPAFMIDLAHKDLGIALDLAASANVPVVLGAAAQQIYSLARAQGRGGQDWTAVYAMIRDIVALPVGFE